MKNVTKTFAALALIAAVAIPTFASASQADSNLEHFNTYQEWSDS